MRTRAISSIWVVVIGLVPVLLGGPLFALLLLSLGLIGYREFLVLVNRINIDRPPLAGYLVVACLSLVALTTPSVVALAAIIAAAIVIPFAIVVFRSDSAGAILVWSVAVTGSLYIGLPLFAAAALRTAPGTLDARWLIDLAEWFAVSWSPQPRGLAWLLIVILAIWLGDTVAFLVGRTWGRHKLISKVSPNKTWEGAMGGLCGSAAAGAVGVSLFGLGIPIIIGALIGLLLGAVGQTGDLSESYLKRQAGVKDSGNLIPGHGGVLDRIDALLFALPAGWVLAHVVDRITR